MADIEPATADHGMSPAFAFSAFWNVEMADQLVSDNFPAGPWRLQDLPPKVFFPFLYAIKTVPNSACMIRLVSPDFRYPWEKLLQDFEQMS